ncbi:MAG: hypothetical protein LCH61_16110 [Proteobacteria bacterium]|nr:hypothetical protein [Pseudomonadota bacterium]
MTKTAKTEARIEEVRNEADSAVKTLFRVVDKAKNTEYLNSVRSTVAGAADTVKDKAGSLRTSATSAVNVVSAGTVKGVEGLTGLGHHIVDASYANLARTTDMVKDLANAPTFGDVYRIEADYIRSIAKQNYDQLVAGVSIIRNIFATSVKAAKDQSSKAA